MWKIKENSLLAPPWIQKNSFWNYCEVALVKTAPLLPHRQKFLICSANITDEEAVGYLLIFLLSCPWTVSHVWFGVISSCKKPWSKFLADVLLLPFPCPPFGLQKSCYQRHPAPPSDKTENLTFIFIHCHYQLPSNTFLFLFFGQGVKELLYKYFLLLGSLSSRLQPEVHWFYTYFAQWLLTEMSTTLDTVIDWPAEDSWLVSYWAWPGDEVLNVLCKTLFCVLAVVSHYKALSNSKEGCRAETFAISAQVTQLKSNGLTAHLYFTTVSHHNAVLAVFYETSHQPRLFLTRSPQRGPVNSTKILVRVTALPLWKDAHDYHIHLLCTITSEEAGRMADCLRTRKLRQ